MENASETQAAVAAAKACCASTGGGGMNRRALYIGLGVVGAAGLVLGWDWLAAVGAASVILAVAPCLIMCALGLCASHQTKTEVAAKADPVNADAPVTRTSADEAPVTNTAVPDNAIAKIALDHAPNMPASETRA